MVCIYCAGATSVTNSRHQKRVNRVWRRRKCKVCRAVFSTTEQTDTAQAWRVTKNGVLEPFSAEKLLLSVFDSLRHRKTAVADATALSQTIQSRLFSQASHPVIEQTAIAEAVASVLQNFDAAAAVHYKAFHPGR